MSEPDFLDKLIADRQARNPDFRSMVEAAPKLREPQDPRGCKETARGIDEDVVRGVFRRYAVATVGEERAIAQGLSARSRARIDALADAIRMG